jgi:hypothetical protein
MYRPVLHLGLTCVTVEIPVECRSIRDCVVTIGRGRIADDHVRLICWHARCRCDVYVNYLAHVHHSHCPFVATTTSRSTKKVFILSTTFTFILYEHGPL